MVLWHTKSISQMSLKSVSKKESQLILRKAVPLLGKNGNKSEVALRRMFMRSDWQT